MSKKNKDTSASALPVFQKSPTGINGLDEITAGGLPKGRTTLICGGPGCGKTVISMEYLVKGITEYGEPGVYMAFEETAEELAANVASLGFDVNALRKKGKLYVDYVYIDRTEILESGEYDLEGLFIRLGNAIEKVGAKRVVLDTIESLFAGLENEAIIRSEIRRLFRWLKDKGITSIVTGESGNGQLTRQGLEEFVSDCVIFLENRVEEQVSTRTLRIVKYRGSTHGSNEYPFLIDEEGVSVLPITSLRLEHKVSSERVSTGITGLDEMLSGKGYYRGSTVLISGNAGTGKTSIASYFAHEAAAIRKEKCLFFSYEESPDQIIRNMSAIGLDLTPEVKNGRLKIHTSRPTVYGLEMHLAAMHKMIKEFQPDVVIIDPISNLITIGSMNMVRSMLMRMIDFLKSNMITALFTALTKEHGRSEQVDESISSLVDSWIMVRDIEQNGERNRGIYVLKSRGMEHSNQIREFRISRDGIQLQDVYVTDEGVLIGSAKSQHLWQKGDEATAKAQAIRSKKAELERKRQLLEANIAVLQAQYEAEQSEFENFVTQQRFTEEQNQQRIDAAIRSRNIQDESNKGKKK